MGLQVLMLTGDNRRTAMSVAEKIGIKAVVAEVLPENKAEELKTENGRQGCCNGR